MLEILKEVPLFVYPLFVIFLILGLKARKTHSVSIGMTLIPAFFFTFSTYLFLKKYSDVFPITLWFLALGVGVSIGSFYVKGLNLKFNTQKKSIEIPGSLLPLSLSLSLFVSKFIIGILEGVVPEAQLSILAFEILAAFILGVFNGRGFSLFICYSVA